MVAIHLTKYLRVLSALRMTIEHLVETLASFTEQLSCLQRIFVSPQGMVNMYVCMHMATKKARMSQKCEDIRKLCQVTHF